jgi:hypothetical protein
MGYWQVDAAEIGAGDGPPGHSVGRRRGLAVLAPKP